jgi:hypothetical protein
MEKDDYDFSIWNIHSVINYIKEHFIQLLLLLLVPIIIYTVDHIANINAMIFSLPSAIPGLPPQNNKLPIKANVKIPKKRGILKK